MGNFRTGAAAADITPSRKELEELEPMLGNNKNLYPGGVKRPLLAKAIVLKTNAETTLIITADLHNTPRWLSDRIRSDLEAEFKIKKENIAICTSQTHSALEVLPAEWSYTRRFAGIVKKTAGEAIHHLRPAAIGVTKGYCHDISYNYNIPITAETPTGFYPDKKYLGGMIFARDHVIGRAGGRPFDPEIGVIRIDDARNGKPIAVLYNFSCHPATCIEGEYMHGDYVSFASEEIEARMPGAAALFLQGSLGNSQSIPIFGTWENCQRNGRKLAKEVLRVLPDIKTTDEVSISTKSEPFPVTFIPYEKEEIEKFIGYIHEFLAEMKQNPAIFWVGEGKYTINLPPKFSPERRRRMILPLLDYCENKRKLLENGNKTIEQTLDTEIQVFKWNDIILCMNAFEMFYQTGLEIKRTSPFRYTFPAGNTNSLVGYVVPQEEFEFKGYNAFTSPMYCNYPGMIDPGNCDRIIERYRRMMTELKEDESLLTSGLS